MTLKLVNTFIGDSIVCTANACLRQGLKIVGYFQVFLDEEFSSIVPRHGSVGKNFFVVVVNRLLHSRDGLEMA